MVVLPKGNGKTLKKLGIQLMIRKIYTREKGINLNPQLEEKAFKMVMLSSYSLENIEEEE